jgi:hypothetical protein
MTLTNSVSLNTQSPLSYNDWLKYQDALNPENHEVAYFEYVQSWYSNQSSLSSTNENTLKQQYIQLLKDLSFLFASSEKDNSFLNNIDYTSDEDIIYAIPFFAKKLRQIAIVLQNKRESVKRAKLKYNLVGSNEGLEKLFYEYILKGFTNTENSITQVPASPLIQFFPDLSSVKDTFFIELEELHDITSYFDSDPSVVISNYLDTSTLSDLTPLSALDNGELNAIISTRFLPRVAETPLSNVFKDYLLSIPTLSTASLSSNAYNLVYNEIFASRKYMGETVYGLTAVSLQELNQPDVTFNLNITQGNNWFYWPSGNNVITDTVFNNTFEPILINDSNFLKSEATAGTDYTNSDLIFTDKNGVVEGAWLQGPYPKRSSEVMLLSVIGGNTTDFIFPFPGISIDSKSLVFQNYTYNDNQNYILNLLPSGTRSEILNAYYTSTLPNVSANSIYLNQTSLIDSGAYASTFSTESDNLIKKSKSSFTLQAYNEALYGGIDQAYVYKFQRTDLPINTGVTQIHWPIYTYTSTDNSPITIKNDCCVDVNLADINPSYTMTGAVAGSNFASADVLYKLNSKNGNVIEAAWLGADDISNLDIQSNSIQVYTTSAVKCSQPVNGPIQSSLSFIANGLEKVSFVWCDQDTPADEVFKYIDHLPTCPYGNGMPHDFYHDQDYQNTSPINSLNTWEKCICNSVYYSPIGHAGNTVTDYNGMADYLFADPDGLGSNFTLNSWFDTRGLNPSNSPQFSFYKITGGDSEVGWGEGRWQTGSGAPMILKTGKRYTYYRSSLRQDSASNPPYFIANYQYKNITGLYSNPNGNINTNNNIYDLAIIIDVSRSQTNNLDYVKSVVTSTINKILNSSNGNVQITVITFGTSPSRLSWLTQNYATLEFFVSQIQIPIDSTKYQTDIADALLLAQNTLTTAVSSGNANSNNLTSLCNQLNYTIIEATNTAPIYTNVPNPNAVKNILIFSDGAENYNTFAQPIATKIKESGINIYGVNIGKLGQSNTEIENISNGFSYYFDLQKYLVSGDGDLSSFSEYITKRLNGTYSSRPIWYKAFVDSTGEITGTSEISDMVLKAGDYLAYKHQPNITYTSPINATSFNTNAISFTINIKLDGWDYINSMFDVGNIGPDYGAKPFWGKVYTSPDSTNNWYKGTMAFGGQVRFFNKYTPLHQPEISTLTLTTGDNIQYVRNIGTDISWQEDLTINTLISTYQWNQLLFAEQYSNLSDFLKTTPYDGIITQTYTPSELTLESYSLFKPAYYNYYAQNNFNYEEYLYYKNRCLNSFVYYNTAAIITPVAPYANLSNIHYPTLATVSFPSNAVSDKQVGEYLLPEKLGTSYYRGRGYTITLDNNALSAIDALSAERIFFDLEKYGPRNRGLTKKDQITPTKISNIDNSWMMEPYSSASKGGVMVNVQENQKLTPYQTSYETYETNHYGLARQNDVFEFWTPAINGMWNDQSQYPLNFRKELPANEYFARTERLLTDKGDLTNWRNDIYGNDYGLYKKFEPNDLGGLTLWFSADYGTINQVLNNPFLPDVLADSTSTAVSSLSVVKWLDRSSKLNNLDISTGMPILKADPNLNNNLTIYFDGSSNFFNDININTGSVSMFVVGSYLNASVSSNYAASTYQVMAGFGTYLSALDINYVNNGVLVFSQKFGDFNFEFGNPIGYVNGSNTIYEIHLTDYYYDIWADNGYDYSYYPPTTGYYLFEAIFNQPYAQTYINGNLFADNIGTLYPSDSANYFDTNLYSTNGFWVGSYVQNKLKTPCNIAEIIMYNNTLTDSQRQQVENYLMNKYGL